MSGTTVRDMAGFLDHVSRLGYSPEVVIDVGVAWGTPELYDQFPKAYFILIEALPIFEIHMQRILGRVSGEYHLMAVGDKADELKISINTDPSSLAGTNVIDKPIYGDTEFNVKVDTIDRILESSNISQGAALKLDVQGADLRALTGATETLKKCDLVIVEASFFHRQNKIRDIINFLFDQDFDLYELFGILNRPYDGAQGQVDLAFVRNGCHLTTYRNWN